VVITLYGIKNCDSIKKARTWLSAHKIEHRFHDYKVAGVERESLQRWCKEWGWEAVLNRAGTTFRKLTDAERADLNESKAIELMLKQPSMIKRPIVALTADGKTRWLLGFKEASYASALLAKRD